MLRHAFDAKFWGHITTVQAVLPRLASSGSITLLGAVTARAGMPGTAGIAAINGAVEALVKPLAVELAEAAHGGFIVPFKDPAAAADAVLKLDADPDLRVKMGIRAHEYAQRHLAWPPHAAAFVAQLETWAATGR